MAARAREAPIPLFAHDRRMVALATVLDLLMACLGGANPAEAGSPPVAVSARLLDEGGVARLTFDLSSSVEAQAYALADPDRIVVDIPEVNFQLDPTVGRPQRSGQSAIVKMFRFGLFGPGKSRIVIDLSKQARIDKVWIRPIAPGAAPARLEIDLSACDAASFEHSVRSSATALGPTKDASRPAEASGPPVIVLDPGHGGIDGGAAGPAGEVEKTIVYQFTLELARKLEALNRFKVVLTRQGDEFVSLGDRVKIARDAQAALLISIHADTLVDAAGVSGATVYTLSDRASDAVAARVAESENSADKAAGVEQNDDSPGVADILYDLKRRETRTYAHMFSRGIVDEWKGAARLNRNPERSAGFVVLKAPDFPSVLIELGYLSSRQDAKSMASEEWRDKATTALTRAVVRFFSPHSEADKAPSGDVSAADSAARGDSVAR